MEVSTHPRENLEHALANDCTDERCMIHHPDLGIESGEVSLTQLAFFIAGATSLQQRIQDEFAEGLDELVKEDFIHYHEEALRISPQRRVW